MKVELDQLKEQNRQQEAAEQAQRDTIKLYAELDEAQARMAESQAKVILMLEEAATIKDDSRIALLNTQIGLAKVEMEGHKTAIKVVLDAIKLKKEEADAKAARKQRKQQILSFISGSSTQLQRFLCFPHGAD